MRSRTPAARLTVWLDVGGVLFRNVVENTPFLRDLADAWRLPHADVRAQYTEAQEGGLEVGHGRLAELWAKLRGGGGEMGDSSMAAALYLRNLRPDRDAWTLARAVGRRYPLYLTNNEIAEWDYVREHAYPSATIARGKVSSFQIGVAKPCVRFFQECLGRLQVEAREVIYFDDDAECVAVAATLGIRAHLWTGVRDASTRLGIAPPAGGRSVAPWVGQHPHP